MFIRGGNALKEELQLYPRQMKEAMSTSQLRLENVSMNFQASGDTLALENISLSVETGEFVVLVGPSGCGKSTILELIAGFIKPTTGKVMMHDRPVAAPGPDRLMMFQDHALFPWLSVKNNVAFGLLATSSKADAELKALEFINLVGLSGFEKHYIHQLSGGMRHRVALARALAASPEILLIDEPFPAIDAITRISLYDELQSIFIQKKNTMLAVTHDVREAACLGDRILVLSPRPGRVVGEIKIDLPRPRSINSEEVFHYSEKILKLLYSNREHNE